MPSLHRCSSACTSLMPTARVKWTRISGRLLVRVFPEATYAPPNHSFSPQMSTSGSLSRSANPDPVRPHPPFVLSPYPKLMPKFPLILLCPYSPRRPRPLCAWNTL